MRKYNIALMPGDGVGNEVVGAARQVMEAVAELDKDLELNFKEYTIGYTAYKEFGNPLPEEAMKAIPEADAVLLGAMSTGLVPPPSPMGALRRAFDLYADVRPIQSYPGVWCLRDDIDIVCIRENTQGFLADRNMFKGYGEFMPTEDVVMSLRVLSRKNCERIARFAFNFAREQKRKKVTVAHKANVLRFGDTFFLDICKEVAKEYPDIEFAEQYVDSVANDLVAAPQKFDVLLTTNMFGDIISDEAAALVSSMVGTANFSDTCAIFRPIHEAQLNIAGKGIADPVSTILSSAMLLEWLKEFDCAAAVKDAVKSVLAEGKVLTPDLGGTATTAQMTEAIIKKIQERGL